MRVYYGFRQYENYIFSNRTNSINKNNEKLSTFDDFSENELIFSSKMLYIVDYNENDVGVEYFGVPVYNGSLEDFKINGLILHEYHTKLYELISQNGYSVDYHVHPYLYIID